MNSRPLRPINARIFLGSFVLALCAVLGSAAWERHLQKSDVTVSALTPSVSVTAQITPASVPRLHSRGFATLIDLRPDGEAAGQPSSTEMATAARAAGMAFRYLPVPHGRIPESAVVALRDALEASPQPVLMYCRTGRRAARTWGLVEASRPGGLDAASIAQTLQNAGQNTHDLDDEIGHRVEHRATP